jgi:hypothetical protein
MQPFYLNKCTVIKVLFKTLPFGRQAFSLFLVINAEEALSGLIVWVQFLKSFSVITVYFCCLK